MKKKTPRSVIQVYLALLQSKKPITVTQIADQTGLTPGKVHKAMCVLAWESFIKSNATPKQVEAMTRYIVLLSEGKNPKNCKETKWYVV
jgi:predicted ArsR family transcriptional regulator